MYLWYYVVGYMRSKCAMRRSEAKCVTSHVGYASSQVILYTERRMALYYRESTTRRDAPRQINLMAELDGICQYMAFTVSPADI